MLHWISLVLLAGWWQSSTGLVSPPEVNAAWWIVLGWLCAVAAREKEDPARLGLLGTFLCVIPAGVAAVWLGLPGAAAAALIPVACGLGFLTGSRPRLRFLATGSATAAYVLAFQGLGGLIYWLLGPFVHHLPFLAAPVAAGLRALGVDAGSSGGVVVVPLQEDLLRFTPSTEHLGALCAVVIVLGAIPLVWLHAERPLRSFGRVILVVLGYVLLRYFFLVATFRLHGQSEVFWWSTRIAVSFVPLAFLLAKAVPLRATRTSLLPEARNVPPPGLALRSILAPTVAFLLLGFALGFEDPGIAKQGRVLFDERHSDWEWTEEEFDTTNYGLRTSYNYYDLYRFLDRVWELSHGHDPLGVETLADVDVLVLRTPTRPFAPEEIEAVVGFVRRGGGLWLIGDHTNVFGTATHLNEIAGRFGIRFAADCAYDLTTGGLNVYTKPSYLAHPAVQRLPAFLFATPCTLQASPGVRSVMTGNLLSVLPADYGQPNFFPRPELRRDFLFGPFLLSAARCFGKGRVLAFTDSTVFSNFFMFIPGKPELALGSIEWINRINRWGWVPILSGCLGVLFLLLSLIPLRSVPRGWAMPALVSGAWLGGLLSLAACKRLAEATYRLPSPKEPARTIRFDLEHSALFLPITRLQREGDKDFATFFTWTQRLGLMPVACSKLEDALADRGVVVVIDPARGPDPQEVAALRVYVEQGGALLVLDGSANEAAEASAQFLSPFGMDWGRSVDGDPTLSPPFELVKVGKGRTIRGGEPLLTTAEGQVVAAWTRHGAGRVIACGLSQLFSTDRMGTVSVRPSEEHLAIFDIEYDLLWLAVGDKAPPFERSHPDTAASGAGSDQDR